ncbi:DUF4328 domain-containing protein [Streptomyces mayteni]
MGAPPPPQYPYQPPGPQPGQPMAPYAGYPYPMPMGPTAVFASPRGLSIAVSVLLGVCAGFSLLMAIAAFRMWATATDIKDGNFPPLQEAQDVEDFFFNTIGLQALSFLASGILFIIWFYRIRTNAEVFDPNGQRLGRGWSIGAWFTPVVNFWFPKQIANDAWRASTPWGANPGGGVMNAWWALWIATLVLYISVRSQGPDNDDLGSRTDLDRLQGQSATLAVTGLVIVAAAIVGILFVRQLSARQQTKYAQGPVPPGASMPMPMPGPMPGGYPVPGGYPMPGGYPPAAGAPQPGAYPPGAYPPPAQGQVPPGQPPMAPPG